MVAVKIFYPSSSTIIDARFRTCFLLFHFQNDGATVESSTLVYFSLSSSMLLELKRGERKGVGKGQRRVLIAKTNVCGGGGGGSLRLAPALLKTQATPNLYI